MRHFPGYFPPDESAIQRLWEDCIFVVDANILLNLYRYSDATREEFAQVLKQVKDRLWLPHRAAAEYFENRPEVILGQQRAYEGTLKTLRGVEEDLKSTRSHPFLSDNLSRRLALVLRAVCGELEAGKETHAKRIASDEIRDAVATLFDGKVGEPFSQAVLETICKEGERRYARKVPPGYKDNLKESQVEKFGDFIIWRQILDLAETKKTGVIFICDDRKEDWWYVVQGRTLGPRPELIKEFSDKTSQCFHMYRPDRFLDYASKYLKQTVKESSVREIRNLRAHDAEESNKRLAARASVRRLQRRQEELENELSVRQKDLAALGDELSTLTQMDLRNFSDMEREQVKAFMSKETLVRFKRLSDEIAHLKAEIGNLESSCVETSILRQNYESKLRTYMPDSD